MNPIIPSEIRLRRSYWLLATLITIHLGALVIALTMPLSPAIRAGIAIAVLTSLAHTGWQHFLRRNRHAVLGLKITRDGLKVESHGGEWTTVEILASSFVSPWLTVLNLHLPQQRLPTYVVLLPDMLGPDEFRRLRIWLKWADPLIRSKEGEGVL
jgi:toxin CptA